MGVFCFAHGQNTPKQDSTIEEVKSILIETKNINREAKLLLKQKEAQKMAEIKVKKKSPKSDNLKESKGLAKSEALKPEPTKQVIEVDFKVYKDLIRGGFFYRILHKDDYKVRYYKIIGNEKVYLN